MGSFDQAAFVATQADPSVVPNRLLKGSGLVLRFREWVNSRTLSLPGGPDRTADLVAALDDPADIEAPWLMVLELQAQVDAGKLEVALEETAILRCRTRHGEDEKGKYKVVTGLVYLVGRCPVEVIDMTLPDGRGMRYAPLIWNVAEDNAETTLDGVASGELSWGMLFWPSLMAGGGEEAFIARWRDVVTAIVPDRVMRGNLGLVALVLSELAGRRREWKRGLEGWEMMESQVALEWISKGETKGALLKARNYILVALKKRFPGPVPEDVVRLINQQESLSLLDDWFQAALGAPTFEEFMTVLKR